MNQKFYSILSLFFLTFPSLFAAENDTVGRTRQDILQGVLLDRAGSDMAGRMSWENPALLPWMLPQSRCTAVADYSSEKESQPLTGGKGEGSKNWEIGANAYILTPGGCVAGKAGYVNGTVLSPVWNESGEYDRIYPYLIADSIGGNLHSEKYYFEGGYSHKGRNIAWGVEGGYTAILSYRNVDPRPRNVSGDLTVKGGFSYRVWNDYFAGLSLRYNRYRLSTDVSFVNETGETKLFHLTGLGAHYSRFDGAGSSVFNDCHTGGFSLNLLPSKGKGVFLNADFSLMGMRHVISDLNRLPMANLNDKGMRLQAGYKSMTFSDGEDVSTGNTFRYGAWGEWEASRRHGRENIFGDASSGSYPQIGTLSLFADNSWKGAIAGYFGTGGRRMNLYILPRAEWSHRRMVYVSPRRDRLDEHITLSANFRMNFLIGHSSFAGVRCGLGGRIPTSSLLSLPAPGNDNADKALYELTQRDFANATSKAFGLSLGGEWLRRFSGRLAAGITADYSYSHVASGISVNCFSIGLTAEFL